MSVEDAQWTSYGKAAVVLRDGPFNGEMREVQQTSFGDPPETLNLMESSGMLDVIAYALPGAVVPIVYHVYKQAAKSEAGIWLYKHDGSSTGLFHCAE